MSYLPRRPTRAVTAAPGCAWCPLDRLDDQVQLVRAVDFSRHAVEVVCRDDLGLTGGKPGG